MVAVPEVAEGHALTAHDSREVWELLSALRALRAHIWLGRSGEPALGLSVILAVDPTGGDFLIDALREHDTLHDGAALYFDTQVEGRRLRFECRLAERVMLDDGPAYRLDTPVLALDQQRRGAYRVRVPSTMRLPAAINDQGRMLPARLLDLSVHGCSARVETAMTADPGEPVRLHLKLNDTTLTCGARVRNVQRMPGAARVGLEFELDTSADSSSMDQAVARLQRELLRRRFA